MHGASALRKGKDNFKLAPAKSQHFQTHQILSPSSTEQTPKALEIIMEDQTTLSGKAFPLGASYCFQTTAPRLRLQRGPQEPVVLSLVLTQPNSCSIQCQHFPSVLLIPVEPPAGIHLPDLGSHTHTGALSSSSPPEWSSPDGCTQLWTGTGRAAGTGAPGAARCAAALPSAPGPVFSLMRICVKEHNNTFPVYPQHSHPQRWTIASPPEAQ